MPIVRRAQFGDQVGIHESHMRSIREICVHDHGEEETKSREVSVSSAEVLLRIQLFLEFL